MGKLYENLLEFWCPFTQPTLRVPHTLPVTFNASSKSFHIPENNVVNHWDLCLCWYCFFAYFCCTAKHHVPTSILMTVFDVKLKNKNMDDHNWAKKYVKYVFQFVMCHPVLQMQWTRNGIWVNTSPTDVMFPWKKMRLSIFCFFCQFSLLFPLLFWETPFGY